MWDDAECDKKRKGNSVRKAPRKEADLSHVNNRVCVYCIFYFWKLIKIRNSQSQVYRSISYLCFLTNIWYVFILHILVTLFILFSQHIKYHINPLTMFFNKHPHSLILWTWWFHFEGHHVILILFRYKSQQFSFQVVLLIILSYPFYHTSQLAFHFSLLYKFTFLCFFTALVLVIFNIQYNSIFFDRKAFFLHI